MIHDLKTDVKFGLYICALEGGIGWGLDDPDTINDGSLVCLGSAIFKLFTFSLDITNWASNRQN